MDLILNTKCLNLFIPYNAFRHDETSEQQLAFGPQYFGGFPIFRGLVLYCELNSPPETLVCSFIHYFN